MMKTLKGKYTISDPQKEQTYYIATQVETNKQVMIKRIKQKSISDFHDDKSKKEYYELQLKLEQEAYEKINHKNVVKLIDIERDDSYRYLVLEYCNNGSLTEYFEKYKPLGIKTITFIILEIAQGLQAIHDQNFIHCDLQLSNIMIHKDNSILTYKIKGFTRCHLLVHSMAKTHFSQEWQEGLAPELLKYTEEAGLKPSDQSSDIFSLGYIFYKLLYGCTPFIIDKSIGLAGYPELVQKGADFQKNNIKAPSEIQQAIAKLLQFEPKQRMKLQDLIKQLNEFINLHNKGQTIDFSISRMISRISNINELKPPDVSITLEQSEDKVIQRLSKEIQQNIILQFFNRLKHIQFYLKTCDEIEYMKINAGEIPYLICLLSYQAQQYLHESLEKYQQDLQDVKLDLFAIKSHLETTLETIKKKLQQYEEINKPSLPRKFYLTSKGLDSIFKKLIIRFIKNQNTFYRVHFLIISCGQGRDFKRKLIEVTDQELDGLSNNEKSNQIQSQEEIETELKFLEQN